MLGAKDIRPAHPEEILRVVRRGGRIAGPVGVKNMRVVADDGAARAARNMIAGANQNDYHLRNVTPGKDFKPEYFDLRQVAAGDTCVKCGAPVELAEGDGGRAYLQARAIAIRSRWACGF